MCKIDWNTGLRRCPEKMSSLGGPTLKKKKKKKKTLTLKMDAYLRTQPLNNGFNIG